MNAQVPSAYGAAASVETDPRRYAALILSELSAGMIRASEPVMGFAALADAVHFAKNVKLPFDNSTKSSPDNAVYTPLS